jgi:hypothetical protein
VGVQDAVNLGWKLAAAVDGWAPDGLLDTYHAERHPIGEQLARNARAAIELRLTGEEMGPLRGLLGELLSRKDTAEHLAGMLSGLGIRYDMGPGDHPLLGKRMPPHQELTLPDGTRTSIGALLHNARGLVITTTDDTTTHTTAHRWADRIDLITATWTGTTPPDLDTVLIRPDGYIAWTRPGTDHDLTHALTHWFGTPHPTPTPQPATR